MYNVSERKNLKKLQNQSFITFQMMNFNCKSCALYTRLYGLIGVWEKMVMNPNPEA